MTRGRPKTLKIQDTLDVVMMSYWADGIANVSINEICRRAGVSKPGLYREFGNEDGLTKAALEHYRKTVLIPMRLTLKEDVGPEEAVKGLETLYKTDKKRPKGCLFAKMLESQNHFGSETKKLMKRVKKESIKSYELWAKSLKDKKHIRLELSDEFAGRYIDAQFNNCFSLIAQGEKLEIAIDILRESLRVLEVKK